MEVLDQVSNPFLDEAKDREEWEVKIYVDFKRMKDYLSQTCPEKKEEELFPEVLNKKLHEYKEKSFGWISKQALETKLNEVPPLKTKSMKKALILKSTFLVSKDSSDNFTRVAKCLGEEYKSKGLDIECIGPRLSDTLSKR
ncbi:MAG: GvpL/GvpF family gas vesicle protein [Candidatus Zixiibacteriota bacterium]